MKSLDKKIEFILIGDSHAFDKYHGLSLADKKRGWMVISSGNCPPGIGFRYFRCEANMEKIINWAISQKQVRTIILGFASHYAGTPGTERKLLREKELQKSLSRTINLISGSGKESIVLMDVPYHSIRPVDCARREEFCEFSFARLLESNSHRSVVNSLRQEIPNLKVFNPFPIFCHEKKCNIRKGRKILYTDDSHLSQAGSIIYAEHFLREMKL